MSLPITGSVFFYFNPLPRKEGDLIAIHLAWWLLISIHSLVKRETSVKGEFVMTDKISIHSLVKRETPFWYSSAWIALDFNPLPRKEGDIVTSKNANPDGEISIHSLVKRETTADFWQVTRCTDFNPLPRKEGDSLVKRETERFGFFDHWSGKRETPS